MRGRIGVLVSALAAALTLPATAYGAGWSPAQPVVPGHFSFPVVAETNAAGDTVVGYFDYDTGVSGLTKVSVAYRKAGGDWQTHTFGATSFGEGTTMDVGLDNAGRAVVAYSVSLAFDPFIALATYDPAAGSWASRGTLEDFGTFDGSYSPSVAVAPNGQTVVAFVSAASGSGDEVVQAQTAATPLGISGAGTSVKIGLLTGATDYAYSPVAATGSDGTMGVVWYQKDTFSGVYGPIGSSKSPGVTGDGADGWSLPAFAGATDGPGGDAQSLAAAVLPDGTLLTTFRRNGVNGGEVYVNSRAKPTNAPSDPGWAGAGTVLDTGCGTLYDNTTLGVDAAGSITAAWGCKPAALEVVKTATAPAGQAFGAGTPISTPTSDGNSPVVDVAPDGTAVLAWSESAGMADGHTFAAVRKPGAAFADKADLGVSFPEAAIALPGGQGRVFVDRYFPSAAPEEGQDEADEFVFDTVAPTVTVTAPAKGLATASMHLKAAALDVGSRTGAITWTFGDGTSATGSDVDHVFGAPGTYTVKASATDASGNVGNGTAKVVVEPTAGADSTPPGVKVVSKSAKVSGGTATIKVSCPKDEFACVGSLTVKLGKKAGARTVKFTIAGGATAKLTVKLSKAVLVALQNAKSVKVAVTATAKDAAGNTGTGKRNVVLKG